ncbi:MAG TPA: ABC transporter substrate-binding protein [Nocardioides sp.]|uniref:ABC transporter substrate-binding protein n=1 Tax=Nocardioides sp. TaxID=35761 RepID=UPI002CD1F1AC|nr:ABC transporter substrate-binding protein [Nocardioides sp.]HTW17448.1 ABC transporter substrate-binding protein [Nocardioides sp.]
MRYTISRPVRRSLAGAAVGVLVLGLTAACGGDDDPKQSADQEDLAAGDAITITTFGEFGYDALIEQWNEENPDTQVEQTKVSKWDDWKAEITTSLQAGGKGLPDVVALEGDYMPAVVAAPDVWVDLAQSEVEGRWLEFKVDEATTDDGQLLGYATDAGPEAICYRKDLFEAAGLPGDREEVAALMTTWDDYFALGEEFKKNSDANFYDASGSIAQAMLNQVEFPFEQADNSVDISSDELKNVWDTVTSHTDLGSKAVQWSPDWTAAFKKPGNATVACPGWMRNNIKENTGDPAPDGVVWDIADVFPGGGGNWGGSYLTIPKSSTHQAEALEFITWITAPEQQAKVFELTGNFPSQVEALQSETVLAATDEYFNNAPAGEIFSNRAAAITVQPYHGPLYSDILQKFQDAINRVDQGTDPDKSWATFEQDVASLQ